MSAEGLNAYHVEHVVSTTRLVLVEAGTQAEARLRARLGEGTPVAGSERIERDFRKVTRAEASS